MRRSIAVVVFAIALILSFGLPGEAAPTPSEEQPAKAKLEALKKKLPDCLKEYIDNCDVENHRWECIYKTSVPTLRMTGPAEAKLTVRLEAFRNIGVKGVVKRPNEDAVLVIYLTYYDGVWTTRRFDGTWSEGHFNTIGTKFLMSAIDELNEK
jgi:hypothetical protein